jgi:hypothetical protein
MKRKAGRKTPDSKEGLVIRTGNGAPLSRTQVEFNRLMKSLESTKARHASEQARLDDALATSIQELMPLMESINRVSRDIVFHGVKAFNSLKLTAKRRHWFGDLLGGKAEELVADPVGFTDEEIAELEAVIEQFNPSEADQELEGDDEDGFDFIRSLIEEAALEAGVELDLSDLDPSADPEGFERTVNDRLQAALDAAGGPAAAKPRRKPTKAQLEKERKRAELEDAKNRDLKSLFKQLAKAFHPDLEPEPLLKEHKKLWMQRLNNAYAANDLREMLQLEMEWLGEEATNLATAGENVGDDRMLPFQRRERLLVRLVLAGFGFLRLVRQAQLVEQDLAQLLRRGDVERAVRMAVDRLCQPIDLDLKFVANHGQRGGIDGDAFHFHRHQHRLQGSLDATQDRCLTGLL